MTICGGKLQLLLYYICNKSQVVLEIEKLSKTYQRQQYFNEIWMDVPIQVSYLSRFAYLGVIEVGSIYVCKFRSFLHRSVEGVRRYNGMHFVMPVGADIATMS